MASNKNTSPLNFGQERKLSAFGRFLRPATRLMQHLRMRSKLALITASLGIPLCLLFAMSMASLREELRVVSLELEGSALVGQLVPLVQEIQNHRGLTQRVLAGQAGASAKRDATRGSIKAHLATLDKTVASLEGYKLDDQWRPLRAALLGLAEGRHPTTAGEAFAAHTQAVEQLRQLTLINGERSGLILDPEARSYHLVDVSVNGMLPLMEATSATRDIGASAVARNETGLAERAELLGGAAQIEQAMVRLGGKFAALERADSTVPGAWPRLREQLEALARTARNSFASETPTDELRAQMQNTAEVVSQLASLQIDVSQRLDAELGARQSRITTVIVVQAATFTGGVLLLAYLLTAFALNFRNSLLALQECTTAIAEGDMSRHVSVPGQDELADIGRIVDAMSERLSGLVSEIRNSASMVNQTGQQVSDGSTRLAQRTDEQAGSLRDSIGTIGELSVAVAQNADAARRLDHLTEKLATQAEEGNAAMQDTVVAMQRMQDASQRVSEVVRVIDDVAFQTGMLSLNAAIEAARAGEAGKGFAVVASEVRQLAQRCAESAEEIRQLIGNAGDEVQASTGKLENVSSALGTIVDGVREVSMQLRTISTSSTQQSAGLEEVTQRVGNLDEITRENAALVEQSATASSALLDRASSLRAAVSSMRLRKGSADEAVAMVTRALAHIQAVGKTKALADFHDPNAGFIDRDLYIFSLDRTGVLAAYGPRKDLVGQNVNAVPGLDISFVERVWDVAQGKSGWVQYRVANPITGIVTPKESYVRDAGDGWVLGCGIYRHDLTSFNELGAGRAKSWSTQHERATEAATA